MITKDAVSKVLADRGITKYRMAQDMGVAPVSINQWLSTTKMNDINRSKFQELYGVEVNDTI